MKKLLFIVMVAFAKSLVLNAQTVMGINIKTTNAKMVTQMAKKGYKPTVKKKGEYSYKVKFADFENCIFNVKFNTIKNDSVTSVSIRFPHQSPDSDKWKVLYPLMRQLEEKYGKSTYRKEWWDGLSLHEPNSGSRTHDFENASYVTLTHYWNLDKDGREIGDGDNYVILRYCTSVMKYEDNKPSSDL